MLADEIKALLNAASYAEASDFMSVHANPPDEPVTSLAGKQIGAYVVESCLGEGATGSVWRARRADGRFEGWVAVKLLHLSLVGRSGSQRFEREGAILAQLAHPHIAQLLDAGVTADGQPYLVLELVDGTRIDRHCDERGLDIEQRLALFASVLAAVAHAHSHLVIHRDIKPNNILVTADGRVKLLDFGIAKLLQEGVGTEPITVDGQRVLTPQYAAPEQLQGGVITTATDIYALGVLLFRLLAGRHPTTTDAATSAEIIRATLESDPMRLGAALDGPRRAPVAGPLAQIAADRRTPLPRLRRQLQGDLENIIGMSLRKRPAERYQTVAALADDLRRYTANEPVSARRDSLAYRCSKFVRRHSSMVGVCVLTLVAVTAGLAGTITQARRAEAETQRAQSERDRVLRRLTYAKSSNEFIAYLLQTVADKPFTTSDLLARAEIILEEKFAHHLAERAVQRTQIAALYVRATYFVKAQHLLLQARADARDGLDLATRAGIECLLAYLHLANGSFAIDSSDPHGAATWQQPDAIADARVLGDCLPLRGQGDETRAADPSVLTGAAQPLYRNVGVLLYTPGHPLGSLEATQQALDIARGPAPNQPASAAEQALRLETPGILLLGAHAWCTADELARCAALLASARADLTDALPAGHSMLGTLEMTQAQLSLARGELVQARSGLTQAMAVFDAASQQHRHPRLDLAGPHGAKARRARCGPVARATCGAAGARHQGRLCAQRMAGQRAGGTGPCTARSRSARRSPDVVARGPDRVAGHGRRVGASDRRGAQAVGDVLGRFHGLNADRRLRLCSLVVIDSSSWLKCGSESTRLRDPSKTRRCSSAGRKARFGRRDSPRRRTRFTSRARN
ncbi:MAG: serine/threonine-protein kinase [Rhizobacter sp.]